MLYGQIAGTHHKLVPDHAPLAVGTSAVGTEVTGTTSTAIASTAIGPPARPSMR